MTTLPTFKEEDRVALAVPIDKDEIKVMALANEILVIAILGAAKKTVMVPKEALNEAQGTIPAVVVGSLGAMLIISFPP